MFQRINLHIIVPLPDPLERRMSQLSIVGPGAIFNVCNEHRLGEDSILPPKAHCRFFRNDRCEDVAQLA